MNAGAEFDKFAENYEKSIGPLIRLTGEGREYFSSVRVSWLSSQLKEIGFVPHSVMDFGCGTGISTRLLMKSFNIDSYVGVDISEQSLAVARKAYKNRRSLFTLPEKYSLKGKIDMVFTNGVFHHIPIDERPKAVKYVYDSLRKNGVFAFYEYNPMNPLLLLGMKFSPVDKNAIPLTPGCGMRLIRDGGFDIIGTSYLFFFPRFLSFMRRFEPSLCHIPLGAQYLVLARKPE